MKTFIITGANYGLGLETAKKLVQSNHHVILACRHLEKGEVAKQDIESEFKNAKVTLKELDLASFDSIHRFVVDLHGVLIDGLDNNAGLSAQHLGSSVDGYDIVFQSNYLGHFLLTLLLLPQLSNKARILNISSDMHQPPKEDLIWQGVSSLAFPEDPKTPKRYYYSKLCQLYFTYYLSRYLEDDPREITVAALNPGFMSETNLAGGKMTKERADFVKNNMPERFGTLSQSSSAAAMILSDPRFESKKAHYYDRGTVVAKSSKLSYNLENAEELWNESLRLCQLDVF